MLCVLAVFSFLATASSLQVGSQSAPAIEWVGLQDDSIFSPGSYVINGFNTKFNSFAECKARCEVTYGCVYVHYCDAGAGSRNKECWGYNAHGERSGTGGCASTQNAYLQQISRCESGFTDAKMCLATAEDQSIYLDWAGKDCSGGATSSCHTECKEFCKEQNTQHGSGCCGGNMNDNTPWCVFHPNISSNKAGAAGYHKTLFCEGVGSFAATESAAKGDPHLVNIKGEAFDVMQTGNMMLLEIPRGSSPALLDLALHADIEHLGVVSCGPTFITSASITGRWIGVPLEIRSGHIAKEGRPQPKHTFAIRFDGKAWFPHAEMQRTMELSKDATLTARDRMFLFQVRGLDIAVSQPKRPRIFLDIQVKGLGKLKAEIGGLLGIDDHSSVEELPSGCEMSDSSLSLIAAKADENLQWSARALL